MFSCIIDFISTAIKIYDEPDIQLKVIAGILFYIGDFVKVTLMFKEATIIHNLNVFEKRFIRFLNYGNLENQLIILSRTLKSCNELWFVHTVCHNVIT